MLDCGNVTTEIPTALTCFYNVNFAICTVVNAFGLYMLAMHTPKEMKQYKFVLINITCWAYCVDFCGNMLMGPVNLMPLFGGLGQGSLRWLLPGDGFLTILLMLIATTGCINSIVFGFMYRWWIMCFGHWVLEEPWRLPAIAAAPFLVFCPPITYFHYWMWPTREETARYLSQVCPHVMHILNHDFIMILDDTDPNVQHLFTMFNLSGMFNIACLVYALVRIFRKLNSKNTGTMSEKTIRMMRQLTWSLILHTALPGLSYIGPTAIAMVALQMRMSNVQYIMHFMGAIFLTHSTWSVLTMMVTIGAYRTKIFEWLRISRKVERAPDSHTQRRTTISTINVKFKNNFCQC